LRGYNKQGKLVELEHNQGCLGEFETAFDGEMEAITDIMDFVDANQKFTQMHRRQLPELVTLGQGLVKTVQYEL
jgi:hypothetical protein